MWRPIKKSATGKRCGSMFCDTHTHLLDEKFACDRETVIRAFDQNEIAFVIENGTDAKDSMDAAKLAEDHRRVYAAVGVHPHAAEEYDAAAENTLRQLARQPKVVAIGEIGLDYHYDFSPRAVQRRVFEKQLALAEELCLPVVIHAREAAQDTFDILKSAHVRGELHCFSGSAELAEEYLARGFYIAFGGAVTFKNASKILKAAQIVPKDRLLLETDCPYMTPVPYRGQRNEPKYARLTAQKLAELHELGQREMEESTLENARALFGITEA